MRTFLEHKMAENLLCYGDNANFLRDKELFPDESVDLIYLDPPFNSKRPYNILFKDHKGTPSAAQIKAFDDTWKWDEVAQRNYEYIVTQPNFAPDGLKALMDTFGKFLGHSEMFAYLVQMATRLVMMHRVLKKTGSLYLHCDPTASHSLKMVLDAVFGAACFRNEIIWKRTHAHGGAQGYGRVHDVLLFYTASSAFTWNKQHVPYSDKYKESFFRFADPDGKRYRATILTGSGTRTGSSGKSWRGVDPTASGRHWAIPGYVRNLLPNPKRKTVQEALDQLDAMGRILWPKKEGGVPSFKQYLADFPGGELQDVWTHIPPISAAASERLGYPTQKPLELLKTVVAASSTGGDVVLDPFCGCGTTIDAVETLNREHPDQPPRTWIGIDITHLAINLIKHRLARFEPAPKYKVIGEPEALEGAKELAIQNRYQFEYWALGLIGARPAKDERKKGADKGIDGSFNFIDDHTGKMKTVLIQVKSGHVGAAQIRDFRGVLDREKAEMGVFITLEKPTKKMTEEAVGAGHYHSPGWNKDYPRIQILTIEELLADPDRPHPRCLRVPQRVLGETFKEGPKHTKKGPNQFTLGGKE